MAGGVSQDLQQVLGVGVTQVSNSGYRGIGSLCLDLCFPHLKLDGSYAAGAARPESCAG